MLAIDPVTGVLIIGLIVLVASLTAIASNRSAAERDARVRAALPPVVTAPRQLPAAPRPPVTSIEHSGPVSAGPAGQTAGRPDVPPGQRITVDQASALAEHYADADPARIVEVISYWMQEDSAERRSNRSV